MINDIDTNSRLIYQTLRLVSNESFTSALSVFINFPVINL